MSVIPLLALGILALVGAQQHDLAFVEDGSENLCADVKCTMGEYCDAGNCRCYDACPQDWMNYQRMLCVDGVTYLHECDLYRNMCYCRENDARCGDERYFHGHRASPNSIIRYFTECRDLTLSCNWSLHQRYFKYQLMTWFWRLLEPSTRARDSKNVLFRTRHGPSRMVANSLLTKHIDRYGNNAGPLMSYWFCELDVDKSGMIEENELSMLTQAALPTMACLEIFLGTCSTNRIISRDTWLGCFDIDPSDSMQCSSFV